MKCDICKQDTPFYEDGHNVKLPTVIDVEERIEEKIHMVNDVVWKKYDYVCNACLWEIAELLEVQNEIISRTNKE